MNNISHFCVHHLSGMCFVCVCVISIHSLMALTHNIYEMLALSFIHKNEKNSHYECKKNASFMKEGNKAHSSAIKRSKNRFYL